MSLFNKIGISPKWGHGISSIKTFLTSSGFQDKLSAIRKKKLADPQAKVSQEIKDLLEGKK